MNEKQFDQLVTSFYDASLDSSQWGTALGLLCSTFHSLGVVVLAQNRVTGEVPVALSHGIPEQELGDYESEAFKLDPIRNFSLANPHQELIHDHLFMTEEDLDKSPFHQIIEQRVGIRYRVSAKLFDADDLSAFVALQRSREQGPPDSEFLARYMRVVPHLARAVRLATRLGDLELRAKATTQVLDDLPTAILILTAAGRLAYSNRAAKDILDAADALALGPEGLFAFRGGDNRLLQELLRSAADPNIQRGGHLALPRKSGKRPYAVQIVPVSVHHALFATLSPKVIILVTDPERSIADADDWLVRLFGLTRRQAQLANLLGHGRPLAEAAGAMGITEKTARSHLEQVFSKTGTGRQSELVKLIATLPPGQSYALEAGLLPGSLTHPSR